MDFTPVQEALLLAAFFRGNTVDFQRWISCNDQVTTLSLFYTGDITAADCQERFATRGYVSSLYTEDGLLLPNIAERYAALIRLIHKYPNLIQGGGDLKSPASPTFTACRLTAAGNELIPDLAQRLPRTPDFPSWPSSRTLTVPNGGSPKPAG